MPPESGETGRSAASVSAKRSSRSTPRRRVSAVPRCSSLPVSRRFSAPVSTPSTAAYCPVTLDQILDAAVAVADAEGYAALSMNRVAKQLGSSS